MSIGDFIGALLHNFVIFSNEAIRQGNVEKVHFSYKNNTLTQIPAQIINEIETAAEPISFARPDNS